MTGMVLVTGGAGYIGTHACLELLAAGFGVVVLDNLSNSNPEGIARVRRISGKPIEFVVADLRDQAAVRSVFDKHAFDSVMHFAGLKAVGESVGMPLAYYENNVVGTLVLLKEMDRANVRKLVFSSSATVYGDPDSVPIREDATLRATNPYGRSKLMICEILRDLYRSDYRWKIAILRYFNPVGAHPSGEIGEDSSGIPNNLMPYVAQVAVGKLERLSIFGNDYPTHDGTGVRDYIHVVDLARGHLSALASLGLADGILTLNLGTGRGYSVLDLVKAFEAVSGRKIPYVFAQRRPGDIGVCYADASLARNRTGWEAEYDLARMCEDQWRWQVQNPDGYPR
jgi:UDP-glucose 4-epimerase